MYFVYVLVSLNHAKTYTGITDNLTRRLKQHNKGYHLYTRRYLPWAVVYTETFEGRVKARNREKYLKTAAGRRWLSKNVFSDRQN